MLIDSFDQYMVTMELRPARTKALRPYQDQDETQRDQDEKKSLRIERAKYP